MPGPKGDACAEPCLLSLLSTDVAGRGPSREAGWWAPLLPPAPRPQHPGSVSQSQTPARRQSQLQAGLGRGKAPEMYGQLPPQATPKLTISRKLSRHPEPQSDVRHPHPPKKGTDIHLPISGRLGFQDLGERRGGITDGRDKSDSWTSAESQLYHQFQPQPQGTAFKSVTDPDGDPICCPPGLGGEGRPRWNLPEGSVGQAYLDWGQQDVCPPRMETLMPRHQVLLYAGSSSQGRGGPAPQTLCPPAAPQVLAQHSLAWTCRQHLAQAISGLVPSSPM